MPGLDALPGDEKVVLYIKPDLGGPSITHFEYRVKLATDAAYPTKWTRFVANYSEPGESVTVVAEFADNTDLANGTEYAFQVRAVNGVGKGTAVEDTATPQANVPAVFRPRAETGVITGIHLAAAARVPAELDFIVHDSSISDADSTHLADSGEDRFTYQLEWIRVTNGVETVVHTEQSVRRYTSYTLAAADVGSQLKVRMRFRDDRYNQEEFVSGLFPRSGVILPEATCGSPAYTGGATEIWTQEIEIQNLNYPNPKRHGAYFSPGDESFTIGANTYSIDWVYEYPRFGTGSELVLGLRQDLTEADKRQLAFHVCDHEPFRLHDAEHVVVENNYAWTITDSNDRWWTHLALTVHLSRDTAAPTLQSASVNGSTLELVFSERLEDTSSLANTAFTVKKTPQGGSQTTLTLTGEPTIEGATVELKLASASAVSATDGSVLVSYTKPSSGTGNKLTDRFGNEVADFTDSSVTNRLAPHVLVSNLGQSVSSAVGSLGPSTLHSSSRPAPTDPVTS